MMPDEMAAASSPVRDRVPQEPDLLGFELAPPSPSPAIENRPSDSGSVSVEDDDTAQSSTDPQQGDSGSVTHQRDRSSSFGKFFQNTRKRLSGPIDPADEDDAGAVSWIEGDIQEEDDDLYKGQVRPLIYGYLRKYGRNGKWQKRYFETDGESLSYFKSEKRVKLLATLDLFKVGAIAMSEDDPTGCTFSIEVANRSYNLRADTKSTCKDWVITLNRIREARVQLGGVKLVTPKFRPQPPDLLDANGTPNHMAPRVVLEANRPRTHGQNSQAWEHMQMPDASTHNAPVVPAAGAMPAGSQHKIWLDTPPQKRNNLGKWKKPKNTLASLSRRLIRWARSIRSMKNCSAADQQVVRNDRQTHPSKRDDAHSEIDDMSRRMGGDDQSEAVEEHKVEISPPALDDEGEARVLA